MKKLIKRISGKQLPNPQKVIVFRLLDTKTVLEEAGND